MAHADNAVRVAAMLGDVGAHKGIGLFDVTGLGGDIGFGQHAIVDGDEAKAVGEQKGRLGADLAAFAELPGAAMDEKHHRQAAGAFGRIDVELGRSVIEGLGRRPPPRSRCAADRQQRRQ